MMNKILGSVILLVGVVFGVGCFLVFKKMGIVEASVFGGLMGLGAWLLDGPDVAAFFKEARGFLPGAKP